MIVAGIARIKLPSMPPTNRSGVKHSAAVAVAAIMARDTFLVAIETISRAFFDFRRRASMASTMMIVSSTISDRLRIKPNSVIVLRL